MAIQYAVVPNSLQPGQYYPRPVATQTRDLSRIISGVEKKTTVSASDIAAVVQAFTEEVVEALLDGVRVSIDGLADFSIRLSQVMFSPEEEFDFAAGGDLLVAATIKSPLTNNVRANANFEKLVITPKVPKLLNFRNATTKTHGEYTPGSIGSIVGENLRIGDESDPEQGVFFVAVSDATESKVNVLENNGDRKLVFQIPPGITGEQRVFIRTRYTPLGQLRNGELATFVTPA